MALDIISDLQDIRTFQISSLAGSPHPGAPKTEACLMFFE